MENDSLQIGGQCIGGLPGKAGHIAQIHASPFPNGDGQGFHGGIHRGDNLVGLNGTLGKHICLALEISVIVQNFQSAQEIVGRIIREGQTVSATVEDSVHFRKAVMARCFASCKTESSVCWISSW